MKFLSRLQRFFSAFLFLLGVALVVVAVTNYFIAPIHTLMEDPVRGNLIYLVRLISAGVICATGLFGILSGKGAVHLMFALASVVLGSMLYLRVEWYIAIPVIILSSICFLLNFFRSFAKKKKKEKKE